MSDTNVAERLKIFIQKKGLSYSQFADSWGIPRPSLSQLLTGRNKKINDIMVGQIHNMFPELSIVWLLFGEGEMENNKGRNTSDYDESDPSDKNGLDDYDDIGNSGSKNIIFPGSGQSAVQNSKENGLKKGQFGANHADFQPEKFQKKIKELQSQIDQLKKNPRKAVQIMVYYDDSTFETFYPE